MFGLFLFKTFTKIIIVSNTLNMWAYFCSKITLNNTKAYCQQRKPSFKIPSVPRRQRSPACGKRIDHSENSPEITNIGNRVAKGVTMRKREQCMSNFHHFWQVLQQNYLNHPKKLNISFSQRININIKKKLRQPKY